MNVQLNAHSAMHLTNLKRDNSTAWKHGAV